MQFLTLVGDIISQQNPWSFGKFWFYQPSWFMCFLLDSLNQPPRCLASLICISGLLGHSIMLYLYYSRGTRGLPLNSQLMQPCFWWVLFIKEVTWPAQIKRMKKRDNLSKCYCKCSILKEYGQFMTISSMFQ